MSFKDRMIEAEERGLTTADNAYEYVRESMAGRADIARKEQKERGFAVGDRVAWRDDPADTWTGYITSVPADADFVFVKLDVGGTFRVPIGELKRETP